MSGHSTHGSAHASSEEQIVGVTRDPVLRPVGTVLLVAGVVWALFWGMATQAGSLGQPIAAAVLIVLGGLAFGVGKARENI